MQKALYERYAAKLLLVCQRYTQHKTAAEDILQEGFIKIFSHIHQFNFTGNFEGWLRMIVVNAALEHIRKKKISFTDIETFETEIIASNNYNTLSHLELKELLQLIQQLPEGCKIIFNV